MNNVVPTHSTDVAPPKPTSKSPLRFLGHLLDRLSTQEKINFSRHLAIVIKAGLPAIEGLRIIQKQSKSRTLKRIIGNLIADVNSGRLLADSLKEYQRVFGDFFISIVEVGEASGTLGENLLYLSEEMKKSESFKRKVKAAMIYPAILFVMTLAVSAFLTFFIFPKLMTAFANLNVPLPWETVFLITALSFLKDYYAYVIGGVILLTIIMRLLMTREPVRYGVHRFLLYIPVLSSLVVNVNMASFTRVFGLLLKSGIKIVESLNITGTTLSNLVYRHAMNDAAERVKRGEPLARVLEVHGHIFPPIATGMIEIGESTGNLEENLEYLANYYTEEVDTSLKSFTAIVEPLILVFMGLIVGFVAISIITPIYSLSQGVSGV